MGFLPSAHRWATLGITVSVYRDRVHQSFHLLRCEVLSMTQVCLSSQPGRSSAASRQLHHLACTELWPRPEGCMEPCLWKIGGVQSAKGGVFERSRD